MHPTPIAACLFVIASGTSAFLLSCQIGGGIISRSLRLLLFLTLWEVIQIVPIHAMATLQLVGWIRRISIPIGAAVQVSLLVGIAIWWWRSAPVESAAEIQNREQLPFYILWCAAVLFFSFFVFAANAFMGFPSGSDAVIYHLPLATQWLQTGSLALPTSLDWHYSMPGNAEIGMMVLLSSGWQAGVIIVSWIPAVMLVVATYNLAKWICRGNRVAAITVSLIVLSIPMVTFQIFSAYVDLLGTACILAAFAIALCVPPLQSSGNSFLPAPIMCFLSGLACGISVGTKLIYDLYALVFCIVVGTIVIANRRRGWKAITKSAVSVFLGIALPSVFWFARPLERTGNPVYPIQIGFRNHVLFAGYTPTQITSRDFEFNFVRKKWHWLFYPWTEWRNNPGYLKVPYGEGSGFGAAFATFVPLGLLFFFLRSCLARRDLYRNWPVISGFALAVLAWWSFMERLPRFGLPIWVFACVLSAPMIRWLQARKNVFPVLLGISIAVTCLISGSVPLHLLMGRIRGREWTRRQIYVYPELLDEFPAGTRVLNASGNAENNFALLGRHLTNCLIPSFEAPSQLSAQWLRITQTDYVIEASPNQKYTEAALKNAGAALVDQEFVYSGVDGVRWTTWKVSELKPDPDKSCKTLGKPPN